MQKLKLLQPMPRNMWRTRGRMNFPLDSLSVYLPLWHPELNSSPFLSKDLNARTATVTGATWTSLGRDFDGVDDVISLANPSLGIASGFSVVLWQNIDSVALSCEFLDIRNASNDSGEFALIVAGDDVYFYLLRDIASTYHGYSKADILLKDTWQHLAFTWAGGNISVTPKIYLNGVSQTLADAGSSGTDGPPTDTTNTLRIGLNSLNLDDYDGTIGEALIHTRVLTLAEIVHHYQATKWRYA